MIRPWGKCGGRTEEVSAKFVRQAVLSRSGVKAVKKKVQERAKLILAHKFQNSVS